MATSFGIDLIIGVKNLAGGSVKNLNNDLVEQKRRVFELRQEERLRASEAQKSIAAQKQKIATDNLRIKQAKSLEADKRAAFFNNPTEDAKAAKAKLQLLKAEATLSSVKERSLGLEKKIGIQAKATSVAQKSGMSGFISGITQGIVSAELLSNVITGGIGLAIQGVTKGVELFSQQLASATQAQKEIITQTTAIQNVTGLNRSDSKKLAQGLKDDLFAQSLGGLIDPAITAKFANQQFDEVLAANKGNTAKARTQAAELFNRQSFIVQSTGTDLGQFLNVSNDLLAGSTSISQLRQRDAFNDSGINKVLIPYLEKNKIDPLNATKAQLVDALNYASSKVASPEAIAEFAATGDAKIQQFKTTLFDDQRGIFGFLRDIDPNTIGDQTILDKVGNTITLLIGKDGLFDQIGKLTGDTDPLAAVGAVIDSFNGFVEDLNKIVEAFAQVKLPKTLKEFVTGNVLANPDQKSGISITGEDIQRFIFGNVIQQSSAKYLGTPFYSAANGFSSTATKSAASGFYGALSSEMLNKPPSSSIVFANSSENVFTQKQTENLVANSKAIGASANRNINLNIETGAIAIYATPDQNETNIAERAIELLTERINLKISSNYGF